MNISISFDVTGQPLTIGSAIMKYLRHNGNMTELVIPTKLVRLFTMYLGETCSKVWVGKHLSNTHPIENGMKKEMLYCL